MSVIDILLKDLDLPHGAYEKAAARYQSLGEWFNRDESQLSKCDVHIFPQGSFRLGTAIRPLDQSDAYDIDLACKLRSNVTKDRHSQASLKTMVGTELESYRKANNIKAPLISKHRCWRMEYQDQLDFHLDAVPCIPADDVLRNSIAESLVKSGNEVSFARNLSMHAVSITDDRHPEYEKISPNWNRSNPEGYAQWFESRMQANKYRQILERAEVTDLPAYSLKTPLQKVVQVLKRHRDRMFMSDPEVKPISIIITTLAAMSYQGEEKLETAIQNVVSRMEQFVRQSTPRIPNPVDPAEDFADRWAMPRYAHLKLEHNFWNWLTQAKSDFDLILKSRDPIFLSEHFSRKFGSSISDTDLKKSMSGEVEILNSPRKPVQVITNPPKAWRA